MLRVLSLGAGVQSSTLLLMAEHGEIDRPDYAVFSDTQAEPKKVYEWLDWLEKQTTIPVIRVSGGSLREALTKKAELKEGDHGRFTTVPYFTGNGGMTRRQCTHEFKLQPMWKEFRRLLGYKARERIPPNSCEVMIGISWDERIRMKPSTSAWMQNRWPLIEKRMTRGHCLEWMQSHGYPEPPKSSCLECPFHSDRQWIEIKESDEWETVVKMDGIIRHGGRSMVEKSYMHRSLKPIDQVVFKSGSNEDLFVNECEGMCGV